MSTREVEKLTPEEFLEHIMGYYKACQIPQDAIDEIMERYSKSMLGLQAATPETVARIYFNYYLQDIENPEEETFLRRFEDKKE